MLRTLALVSTCLAACLLAGCDDSSSSDDKSSNPPPAQQEPSSACNGYKGSWTGDTTAVKGGVTYQVHDSLYIGASSIVATQTIKGGVFTSPTPYKKKVGTYKDTLTSAIVAHWSSMEQLNTSSRLMEPYNGMNPQVFVYAFPAAGRMKATDGDGSYVYTCR